MSDLISRSALIDFIQENVCTTTEEARCHKNLFIRVVHKQPAIEAVEVKHGEWEEITDDWNDETIYGCSVCKEEFVTIDGTPAENLYNFCPNCGADMRKGGAE